MQCDGPTNVLCVLKYPYCISVTARRQNVTWNQHHHFPVEPCAFIAQTDFCAEKLPCFLVRLRYWQIQFIIDLLKIIMMLHCCIWIVIIYWFNLCGFFNPNAKQNAKTDAWLVISGFSSLYRSSSETCHSNRLILKAEAAEFFFLQMFSFFLF